MTFEINFYSRKHQYHRYSSDDFALKSLGISNYTVSSAELFFKDNPPNPDLKEFFGSVSQPRDELIGKSKSSLVEIMEFDTFDRVYKTATGLSEIIKLNTDLYPPGEFQPIADSDLFTFLDNWDKVQLGIINNEPLVKSYRAVAYKIQNSLSGCMTFNANLTVLNSPRIVPVKLSLTDYKDSQSDRTISFRGSPLITSIPETADGLEHGFRQTSTSAVGSYIGPEFGGTNNPKNTVTGNLRLSYDPSSGKYESGTQQILVRLITNLDPANIPSFKSDELLTISREDVYDQGVDGAGYMGDFKSGSGIPLSKKNGNPYLYGPNFVGGCDNTAKPRIIPVVNRSGKSFRDGDLVMCSLIGGEWIVMEFGGGAGFDPNKKNISYGNTELQQFIIPANQYFTYDTKQGVKQARLTPQQVVKLIRNSFYLEQFSNNLPTNNPHQKTNELVQLNLFASTIPQDLDDPIGYILENFPKANLESITNDADQNSLSIDFFDENFIFHSPYAFNNNHYGPFEGLDSIHSLEGIGTKNILAKNAKKMTIINSETGATVDTSLPTVRGLEVPIFWGILFPDGYKSEQCAKFIAEADPHLNKIPHLAGDPNLRELSATAAACIPFMNDIIKSTFLSDVVEINDSIRRVYKFHISYVRKTGIILPISLVYPGFRDNANDWNLQYVSRSSKYYSRRKNPDSKDVFAVEPLKPNKIQFSSLSLEHLYLSSVLNNTNYSNLKGAIDFVKNFNLAITSNAGISTSVSRVFQELNSAFDLGNSTTAATNPIDLGNTYPNRALSIDESFKSSETARRHIGPYGIVSNMLPPVGDYRRSVAMPVIAVKSAIRTSAENLEFTIDQYCGMSPKLTINVGFGPQIFYTPLGFGMTWQESPTIPSSEQSSPQWGDQNRSDDIDSFGTTALHVKVFEGWPINQTMYIGNYFTVLHFNPCPLTYEAEVITKDDGTKIIQYKTRKNKDGEDEQILSFDPSVDFRIPTGKNGNALAAGTPVTSGVLAPTTEWVVDTTRRAALLSGGGFVYKRNIIGIDSQSIKIKPPSGDQTFGGKGYKVGDKFRFADGTTVEVQGVDSKGAITSFKKPISGRTPGITSFNPSTQPAYLGSTGSEAKFEDVTLSVISVLGYDAEPKQVVSTTRLTKRSDPKNAAEGINTVSVPLNNSTGRAKNYDIFYFFHNDPSHYSIDYTHPFNGGWAQYVISEVNGA